jgi:asparagine synthase (glutamine-hydrolysing)
MELYKLIVDTFTDAVRKRLQSERPLCCLLSGGLDSSLVAAVVQRLIKQDNLNNTLTTLTIGMNGGSDLEYAREVAKHIGSKHIEVNFKAEDGLNAIEDVVYACETFDITTIRASVGQHLIAKYISNHTDFKVVLNGDGADEVEMGYLYTYMAPNEIEAQKDSLILVENISKFDGLRVDRNISYFGLEARVPFLDKEFVDMYLNIDPKLKIPCKERMEKYLIRKAFAEVYKDDPILPNNVLWRKKEAFSDGISQKEKSWYIMTQEYGKTKITSDELTFLQYRFKDHIMPTSYESAYYRKLFDGWFGRESERCIPYFWLPNWSTSKDPSARTLQIYNE